MEIVTVLAIASPIAALVFGVLAMRRGQKTDDTTSGREMGMLLGDIGYMKASVDNIAKDVRDFESRLTTIIERVATIEQSLSTAHNRVDEKIEEINNLRKRAHDLATLIHTCSNCRDNKK